MRGESAEQDEAGPGGTLAHELNATIRRIEAALSRTAREAGPGGPRAAMRDAVSIALLRAGLVQPERLVRDLRLLTAALRAGRTTVPDRTPDRTPERFRPSLSR